MENMGKKTKHEKGAGSTPATVQLVFTPAGSETAGEAQILAAALPLDGEHVAPLDPAGDA